jgi:acyl-CoA synthetase (NDP forming)
MYEALFKQKSVTRVGDIDDLLEVAHLFARYEPPAGDRVAILSTSGGSGALLADLASDARLRLPAPSQRTREKLHDLIPAVASIANPMDMTTQFMNDPEAVSRYLTAFAEDENMDVVIINFTVSTSERTLRLAERIAGISPHLRKPLVVCWPVGNIARQAFQCLEKAGLPLFYHPSRCLSAVGHFTRYGIRRQSQVNGLVENPFVPASSFPRKRESS